MLSGSLMEGRRAIEGCGYEAPAALCMVFVFAAVSLLGALL